MSEAVRVVGWTLIVAMTVVFLFAILSARMSDPLKSRGPLLLASLVSATAAAMEGTVFLIDGSATDLIFSGVMAGFAIGILLSAYRAAD